MMNAKKIKQHQEHLCLKRLIDTLLILVNPIFNRRRRRRPLKGIHSRSDTNRTGAEGLSFYYPRLLYCLNQMPAVMLLSQYRVSSSKTVRPRTPCGARCIGHTVRTWSAVCSEAPHSQFGEGARTHLFIDKWNRPTPVHRRLSLTQAARDKPIPTDLAPVSGTKARTKEAFSQYSVLHLWFVHSETQMPSLARLSKRFRAADTNGRLDHSLTWRVSENPLKRPYKVWSGSRDLRWAKESVAPIRRSSAGCMPESIRRWSVGVRRRHPVTMRKASLKTLSMRRVWALRHQIDAAVVLSCWLD